jgi:hypothetical protein
VAKDATAAPRLKSCIHWAQSRAMEQNMEISLTEKFVAIPKREGAMKRSHCKNGHEMTPKNTFTRRPEGRTECITCRKINSHRGWLKQKSARDPDQKRDGGIPRFKPAGIR